MHVHQGMLTNNTYTSNSPKLLLGKVEGVLAYNVRSLLQATNRRTLGAMVRELGKGGKLVWIAPSGGRDRPDADTGEWLPHKYDAGKLLSP